MKKHISVRIDESLVNHVKSSQTNISRYVENLIKQDLQLKNKQPIYNAIIDILLEDEATLKKLAFVLSRVTAEKDEGGIVYTNDWGG